MDNSTIEQIKRFVEIKEELMNVGISSVHRDYQGNIKAHMNEKVFFKYFDDFEIETIDEIKSFLRKKVDDVEFVTLHITLD